MRAGVQVQPSARLPVFREVALQRADLGVDLVVFEHIVARPVQVAPRVEQRVHILVESGDLVGFRPVVLDVEHEIQGPDEKRQDEESRYPVREVVAFLFYHQPPSPGTGPRSSCLQPPPTDPSLADQSAVAPYERTVIDRHTD